MRTSGRTHDRRRTHRYRPVRRLRRRSRAPGCLDGRPGRRDRLDHRARTAPGSRRSSRRSPGSSALRAALSSLAEHDVTRLRPDRLTRRGLGFVPQLDNVFPTLTVSENLHVGAQALPRSERRDAVAAVVEQFPLLRDRRRQRAGTLSGGQRKLLALGPRARRPAARSCSSTSRPRGFPPRRWTWSSRSSKASAIGGSGSSWSSRTRAARSPSPLGATCSTWGERARGNGRRAALRPARGRALPRLDDLCTPAPAPVSGAPYRPR